MLLDMNYVLEPKLPMVEPQDIFHHKLSKTQVNLLIYLIYTLDTDIFQSVFKIRDAQTIFPNMKYYSDVKKNAENLSDYFSVHTKHHENSIPQLFKDITVYNGVVKVQWNEEFADILLDLQESVIKPHLNFLTQVKSKYTILLFEYLLSNFEEQILLDIDDLRHLLNVQNVKSYAKNSYNFKKHVLMTVFKDISKHEDFHFTLKMLKDNKFRMSLSYLEDVEVTPNTTVNERGNEEIIITAEEFASIIDNRFRAEKSYEEALSRFRVKKTMLLSYVVDITINDNASEKVKALATEVHSFILENQDTIDNPTMKQMLDLEEYFDTQSEKLKPHTRMA